MNGFSLRANSNSKCCFFGPPWGGEDGHCGYEEGGQEGEAAPLRAQALGRVQAGGPESCCGLAHGGAGGQRQQGVSGGAGG